MSAMKPDIVQENIMQDLTAPTIPLNRPCACSQAVFFKQAEKQKL